MIPKYLSAIWLAIAPAMGNHLWQSTVCLGIVGLLTLVLRKNHARVRYGLWLAASIKFLIPFALLVMLGAHLARLRVVPQAGQGFFLAMEEVSQPFMPPATRSSSPVVHSTTLLNLAHLIPECLMAAWFCGFVVVPFIWYARWRRISVALREAVPLREGREVEVLRRLERLGGIQRPIALLLSPASLEPGIFGIAKPVLVWPKGISEHLQDAHLEAILAHEVGHVHRRDNLAAAVHLGVEALFWFHPLVWWLGARLVEERERACDEGVLELGSEPQVYAESILKTCEFCVESPLACVSGVTGADLKKRMVRIMTQGGADRLSIGKKLVLAVVALAAIAGPVVFDLVNGPRIRAPSPPTATIAAPSFEVASIKPDHSGSPGVHLMMLPAKLTASGETIKGLIALGYDVRNFQMIGGPSWIESERYDIQAKVPDAVAGELEGLPDDQGMAIMRLMLQALLADRVKLKVSHASKELPIYALVVAKNGPKLQEVKPGDVYPNGNKRPDGVTNPGTMTMGHGQLTGQGIPAGNLVIVLSNQTGRTVLDRTGLRGKYNITLKWAPDTVGSPALGDSLSPDPSGPSIFAALQEQLGLKLESTKGPVDVIVIDHIERPSEN